MGSPKAPKQVKVHADGCTPSNLELFKDKDTVVFVQAGPGAPATVQVSDAALFGTATCAVGATLEAARAYPVLAPGNYTIGVTAVAAQQSGAKGTTQVLCLGVSGSGFGVGGSGSIPVAR